MAPRKRWEDLSPNTRKRYVAHGKAEGLTPQQTKQYHERGGSMAAFRGKNRPAGVSERTWDSVKQEARQVHWVVGKGKDAYIPAPGELNSLLIDQINKGVSLDELRQALADKRAMQAAYRRGDKKTARSIWERRRTYISQEIYWYH